MKLYQPVFIFACLLLSPLALQARDFVDSETPENAQPDNTRISGDWVLDFSDEFNDTLVNLTKWNVDNSTSSRAARPKLGIQYWMWKSYNVSEADGNLVLKVSKPNSNTMHCGSIHTANKYQTKYGYFEARIKIADAAKGTHTAFWLQGPNMGNVDGTANDGAEIDIFESAWLQDYTKSVVHIDGYGANHQASTKQYSTPGIHSGYHTFAMHWTEDFMKIYYDGKLKVSYADPKWVVKADEFLWLSDGASFGYEGDNFTSQPFGELTNAYVDYIRVWKYDGEGTGSNEDPNLVMNGDFEDNTTWAKSNSDILLSEGSYPVATSNYCRMPGIPSERIISQSITVIPGETYNFEFSGRVQNAHAASAINNHSTKGPATLMAEIYANNTSILELKTQSNTNTTLKKQVTIPAGVKRVTLKLSKNWNVAYIDNVSLDKVVSASLINHKAASLEVFPNICKRGESFTLESEQEIASYRVYNLSGALLMSTDRLNSKTANISTDVLMKGTYIISIQNIEGLSTTRKVFVY